MYIVYLLICYKQYNRLKNNVESSAQTCFSIRVIKQYSAKKSFATELKGLSTSLIKGKLAVAVCLCSK